MNQTRRGSSDVGVVAPAENRPQIYLADGERREGPLGSVLRMNINEGMRDRAGFTWNGEDGDRQCSLRSRTVRPVGFAITTGRDHAPAAELPTESRQRPGGRPGFERLVADEGLIANCPS